MSAREAVTRLFQAFGSSDAARIRDALTPDARWIAPPGNATAIASGVTAEQMLTVDGIVAFMTGAYRRLFQNVTSEPLLIVEAGDTVVMETMFRARVATGRDYANRYCWVIQVREGKVSELREYMDTQAGFAMIFGDAAPRSLVD
jgi:ketosteroid isomerase-like protein